MIIPMALTGQVNLKWSKEIVVNENETLGYARPKVSLVGDGTPLVMWSRRSNKEVFVAVSNGAGFNTPLQVSPKDFNTYAQDWVGPHMVSNGQTVYVAYESSVHDDGYVYVVVSTDGGASFGDTVRVSDESKSRFPTLGLAPDGTLYVAFMVFEEGDIDPHYAVSVSSDGGKTFSKEVKATGTAPGESCDCCPANIVATNNRVTLFFRNNDNNLRDIWASVSLDKGKTFTKSKKIDNSGWVVNSCPSSGPVGLSMGDSLVTVWMEATSGTPRVVLGTADYGNLGIGINQDITSRVPNTTSQNFPIIAGQWNNYGVVWEEIEAGKRFIKFVAGENGPSSLLDQTAITVNEDTNGLAKNPHIIYSNGVFHITWADNRTKKVYYRSAAIEDFTSLKDDVENEIQVYPNPSSGIIKIDHILNLNKIVLKNSLGQIINSFSVTNLTEFTIDLSNETKGIYYLSLVSSSKHLIKKVIKL